MQEVDCKKKTVIPCTHRNTGCSHRLEHERGFYLNQWCTSWRTNHSKDKIICACDPDFKCKEEIPSYPITDITDSQHINLESGTIENTNNEKVAICATPSYPGGAIFYFNKSELPDDYETSDSHAAFCATPDHCDTCGKACKQDVKKP